jgi:hypothetical protein
VDFPENEKDESDEVVTATETEKTIATAVDSNKYRNCFS